MPDLSARSLDEWLGYIDSVHPQNIEMGLERVRAVAAELDVLTPAPKTIIIAGTNGKGSTTVALEQLFLAAGLRTGATLSPHVTSFNERVRLNGAEVDDATLTKAFARIESARLKVPGGPLALTYFEFSALAALEVFKGAAVDVALLEVGLGGRLDAFNIVDADLAIVTSIGLDHQEYLGSDLEGIGREKAGVFRAGQPVVLGAVTESVFDAAAALDCSVHALGRTFRVEERAASWDLLPDDGPSCRGITRGALAAVNCALALTAARLLLPVDAVDPQATARACLPGRMERFDYEDAEVFLDVAHNPAGAAFLARELAARQGDRRFVAIIGALADKDAAGVVSALGDRVRAWVTVSTPGLRGEGAAALAARLGVPATVAPGMAEALDLACSLRAPGDGILALGSFSAVEQARALLSDHQLVSS
ncbi:MAG: cyanophycin synthetase [Pseudomonadota bacterium]